MEIQAWKDKREDKEDFKKVKEVLSLLAPIPHVVEIIEKEGKVSSKRVVYENGQQIRFSFVENHYSAKGELIYRKHPVFAEIKFENVGVYSEIIWWIEKPQIKQVLKSLKLKF